MQSSEIPMKLHRLAICLHKLQRSEEALQNFQCALSTAEFIVGQHGPQVVDVSFHLSSLGHFYRKEGRRDEAQVCFERALHAAERARGRDHEDTAARISDLGSIMRASYNYKDALPLFKEVAEIVEGRLGPHHPEVGKCLMSIAWAYQGLSQLAEAETYFERALHIALRVAGGKGEVPPEVLLGTAVVKQQLAMEMDIVHRKQDKLEDAQPLFEAALHIREKQLGYNSPHLEKDLDNLAIMYQSQGRYAKAKPFADRAWKIRFNARALATLHTLKDEMRQSKGESGNRVAQLADELANTLSMKRRSQSAVKRARKALAKVLARIEYTKDTYAEQKLVQADALEEAVAYTKAARHGTREENKRRTAQRAIEAHMHELDENYLDDGVALGEERIKAEKVLEREGMEFARITAEELRLRQRLEESQEAFVVSHIGLIRQAFRIFDEDKSGALGYDEVRRVVVGLGQLPGDGEEGAFEEMVRQVDVDGDGEVDVEEFIQLIISSMPRLVPEELVTPEILTDEEQAFLDQRQQIAKSGVASALTGIKS